MAHLFLQEGPPAGCANGSTEAPTDGGPSDHKLRQYFRFCIETDRSVYGEGFRRAAHAFAQLGIQEPPRFLKLQSDGCEIKHQHVELELARELHDESEAQRRKINDELKEATENATSVMTHSESQQSLGKCKTC